MRERDLQTKLTHYCRNKWKDGSAAIEVKITKSKSLPFNKVLEHQVAALLLSKHGTFNYKIADTGYDKKPFDMFILNQSKAFIAIMFYTRGCRTIYLIDIDVWCHETKTSKRKSLTEKRAKEIGFEINLK